MYYNQNNNRRSSNSQSFRHVRPLEFVAEFAVIVARADARYDGHLVGSVFFFGDARRLLHQQRAEPLVLEFGRIAAAHRHHASVHVQLAHDRHPAAQFRPEGQRRAFAQPEQSD